MTTKTMSSTKEVADRLVELCRHGKFEEAIKELYSKDAESIEPAKAAAQGWDIHIKGLDKFAEKGEQWRGMTEKFHGVTVTDPIVMGNQVTLGMTMDVTMKGMPRMNMEEVAVYEVADGKIVKEQFFY
jgi:SnoaL-like domain